MEWKEVDPDPEFDALQQRFGTMRWMGLTAPVENPVRVIWNHDGSNKISVDSDGKTPEQLQQELTDILAQKATIDEESTKNQKKIETLQLGLSIHQQLGQVLFINQQKEE